MTNRPESKEITIDAGDGIELSGTAVVPAGAQRRPGALLLSGSGPLDRNSNTADQRLDISSTLATALAVAGIATLRFDKRGVAASSGEFVSAGFDDETNDARAAFDALRGLDGIDAERVGMIGHSVGSTIAARIAARCDSVAFAVLLGCAASPGADVMAWQTDRIAATLPGPSWGLGRQFRRSQARHLQQLAEASGDVVRIGKKEEPARWMREYRAYAPLDDLAAVSCPVLAITGSKDIQVDAHELATIEAAVTGACTALAPTDLTHILRSSPHAPSITRYSKLLREPVDDALLDTITSWVVALTNPEATPSSTGERST